MRIVKELNSYNNQTSVDVKAKAGRLEVCLSYNNASEGEEPDWKYGWGTVCDDNFSDETASKICKTFTMAAYNYEFSEGKWWGRSNNTLYKIG